MACSMAQRPHSHPKRRCLMFQRIRLLRIAAPPGDDRTRRQCCRFRRSIQFVESIEWGRGLVERPRRIWTNAIPRKAFLLGAWHFIPL